MAFSLKHKFTSVKSDGVDPTLIQPSNWNAEHDLLMDSGNLLGRTTAGNGVVQQLTQAAVRTFLGLGDAAYAAASSFASATAVLLKASNLSDVANPATARVNIGANNAANLDTGTIADARLPSRLQTADLNNAYLGKTAKATDSDKLNGQSASYYLSAANLNAGQVPNARMPTPSAGAFATYGLFCKVSGAKLSAGDTCPGSDLRWSSAYAPTGVGGAPGGTWLCVGHMSKNAGLDDEATTVFARIA